MTETPQELRDRRAENKRLKMQRLADHVREVSLGVGQKATLNCPECHQPKFAAVRDTAQLRIGCATRGCDLSPVISVPFTRVVGNRPMEPYETPIPAGKQKAPVPKKSNGKHGRRRPGARHGK